MNTNPEGQFPKTARTAIRRTMCFGVLASSLGIGERGKTLAPERANIAD
jgi:hypothetical protein